MDAMTPIGLTAAYEVLAPEPQTLPLVFASPHSGARYPPEFVAASRLDPLALRRSEDSFVDELFEAAPKLGAPLIRALFPRAYVDPNREPFELDPAMFEEPLPPFANTRSPRVAAGLGTIARVVADGVEIYRGKLCVAEALGRIRANYWPYHRELGGLIERTRQSFGRCVLVDCHSMPSAGGSVGRGADRVDFVLGDCHGAACAPAVIGSAEQALRRLGYRVVRNMPYAGGYVTRRYGRPATGVHCLQIEISRSLYMDESKIQRRPGMARLVADLGRVIAALGEIDTGRDRG